MELKIDDIVNIPFSKVIDKIKNLDKSNFDSSNLADLNDILVYGLNINSLKQFFNDLPYSIFFIYYYNNGYYCLIDSFSKNEDLSSDKNVSIGNYQLNFTYSTINFKLLGDVEPKKIIDSKELLPTTDYLVSASSISNYYIYVNHFLNYFKSLNEISSDIFDIYDNQFKLLVNYFIEDLNTSPKIRNNNKLLNSFIINGNFSEITNMLALKINITDKESNIEMNEYKLKAKEFRSQETGIKIVEKPIIDLIENIKVTTNNDTINFELIKLYSQTNNIMYIQLLKIYNHFSIYINSNINLIENNLLLYCQQHYKKITTIEDFEYNQQLYINKDKVIYLFIWDITLLYFLYNGQTKILSDFSPSTKLLLLDIYLGNYVENSDKNQSIIWNKNIIFNPKESVYDQSKLINDIKTGIFLEKYKQLDIYKKNMIQKTILPLPDINFKNESKPTTKNIKLDFSNLMFLKPEKKLNPITESESRKDSNIKLDFKNLSYLKTNLKLDLKTDLNLKPEPDNLEIINSSKLILPSSDINYVYNISSDFLFTNFVLFNLGLITENDLIKKFNFNFYFDILIIDNNLVNQVIQLYNAFILIFKSNLTTTKFNIPNILTEYIMKNSSFKSFKKSELFERLVLNIIDNPNPTIKALKLYEYKINDDINVAMGIFNYIRNTKLLDYYYQANGFNKDLKINEKPFLIKTIEDDWYDGFVKVLERSGGKDSMFKYLIENSILKIKMFKLSSSNFCNYINLYFEQIKKLEPKVQKKELITTNQLIESLYTIKDTIIGDEEMANIKCLFNNYINFFKYLQEIKKGNSQWLTSKEIKDFFNMKTIEGYNLYHLIVLISSDELINYIFTDLEKDLEEQKIKISISVKELDNKNQNLFFLIKDIEILKLLLSKKQFSNEGVLKEMVKLINTDGIGLINVWYNNVNTNSVFTELLTLTIKYFEYTELTPIPGFNKNFNELILSNDIDNMDDLIVLLKANSLLDKSIDDLMVLFENKEWTVLDEIAKENITRIYNSNDTNGTIEKLLEYCFKYNKTNTIHNFIILSSEKPNFIISKYLYIFYKNNYDITKIESQITKENILKKDIDDKTILNLMANDLITNVAVFNIFKIFISKLSNDEIKSISLLKDLYNLPNINTVQYYSNDIHIINVLTFIYKLTISLSSVNNDIFDENLGNYKLIHILYGNGRSIVWQNVGMYLNLYYLLYKNTQPIADFIPYLNYSNTSSSTKIIVKTFAENDFDINLVSDNADKNGLPILEHYLTIPSINELEQNHLIYNYNLA